MDKSTASKHSACTISPGANAAVDTWLGLQIRQLRKSQRKLLKDMAAACQISVGLLSQIERGMSSMSAKTLHALARELNVSPGSLMRNAQSHLGEAQGCVVRAGAHNRLSCVESGICKETLGPERALTLEMWRVRIAPGESAGEKWISADGGEQVGFVIQGSIEIWIDDQIVRLNAGDSFFIPERATRRWRNADLNIAEVIVAGSN